MIPRRILSEQGRYLAASLAGRADRDHWSRLGDEGGADQSRPWWSKGGSIKWIWDEKYFDNVYHYITHQRTTADSVG